MRMEVTLGSGVTYRKMAQRQVRWLQGMAARELDN